MIECARGSRRHFWAFHGMGTEWGSLLGFFTMVNRETVIEGGQQRHQKLDRNVSDAEALLKTEILRGS